MSSEFKEKESIAKYVSSKFDYDLYHEEDHKKFTVIRLKYVFDKKNKTEKWKFFENTKNTASISKELLNDEEVKFIQTPEGFNYCINLYKSGVKTESAIIEKIKLKLKG